MPLISTKQHYGSSIEYCKRFLLIDQSEHVIENWRIREKPVFILLPIGYFIRRSETETSVFLKPQKDIELLEGMYTFKNPVEVKKFLWTHKYLIEILFEANRQIKRVFQENIVEVCLECDRDPEEDFEGLFVIVKTNLSPEESLDLLDRFDEEWFLDNVSGEISSIFNVTVRPV